jgi:hypothetical protein
VSLALRDTVSFVLVATYLVEDQASQPYFIVLQVCLFDISKVYLVLIAIESFRFSH